VGFNGALFNPKLSADFPVGAREQEQLQNLVLAFGQVRVGRGEGGIRDPEQPVDEFGKESLRSPDVAACNGVDGLAHGIGVSGVVKVRSRSGDNQFQDELIIRLGTDDDGADEWMAATNGCQGFKALFRGTDVKDEVMEAGVGEQLLRGSNNEVERSLTFQGRLIKNCTEILAP